jgi:hypothetical protein
VAPVAPAGPGTATTAAGVVTTVGRSHALNASAAIAAANTIEYFMRIPFDYFTKTAHLDRFAATWSCNSKVRHIHARLCSLARIARLLPCRVPPADCTITVRAQTSSVYVRWRTEIPEWTGNNPDVPMPVIP